MILNGCTLVLTIDTVSPPPTIVVAPVDVIAMRSSKTAALPGLNLSNSKAPYGPFQTTKIELCINVCMIFYQSLLF